MARGGFYLGLAVPFGLLGATMQKTVDNTAPNTLVPDPRRGKVFTDEVSADGPGSGIGLVAGYRLPLGAVSYYLDGEVGFGWHRGATDARFKGVGTSDERMQLGESWPDLWSLGKKLSYGATARVGGSPGGLRRASVYLLAGARFADMKLTSNYTGCFSPEPCESSDFESGGEVVDLDFIVWKAGVGMEKTFDERLAFRAEASYSVYSREEWTTSFGDVGVTVHSSINAGEVGFTMQLVRRF